MVGLAHAERPPSLRASVAAQKAFFAAHDAKRLGAHCRDVLATARAARIVEGRAIDLFDSEPERAVANYVVAQTILFHSVDSGKLARWYGDLPPALKRDEVRKELVIFNQLIEMDNMGANLADYLEILKGETPPLALLARITDVAITHQKDGDATMFVREAEHPLLRFYGSDEDAEQSLARDNEAAAAIYAPVAELLGYPGLAGDILDHVFCLQHRLVSDRVDKLLASGDFGELLNETHRQGVRLKQMIRTALTAAGFECSIEIRKGKHRGKLKRKVHRKLEEEYAKLTVKRGTLGEYIQSRIDWLDILNVNQDWSAIRVILHRFNGKELDSMETGRIDAMVASAGKMVEGCVEALYASSGLEFGCVRTAIRKPNGYSADHLDIKSSGGILNREIQIKTMAWHKAAEEGGAAHALYLGGNPALTAAVRRSYADLLATLRPNGNGRSAKPPQTLSAV